MPFFIFNELVNPFGTHLFGTLFIYKGNLNLSELVMQPLADKSALGHSFGMLDTLTI